MNKLLSALRSCRKGTSAESELTFIVNCALVFLLSLTMAYFPVTGFDLSISHLTVVTLCALLSVFFVRISDHRNWRGWYICASVGFILSGLLLGKQLASQTTRFVNTVWAVIASWNDVEMAADTGSTTTLIVFLAAACSYLFSFIIVQGRSLLWMTFVLAPLCTLGFIAGTPAPWCTASLMLCGGVLVATQAKRSSCPQEGARMVAAAAVPIALIVAVLCTAFPESGFDTEKMPYSLRYRLHDLGWEILEIFTGQEHTGKNEFNSTGFELSEPGEGVDLHELGPNRQSEEQVMVVHAQQSGLIYLRGQTYSLYSDGVWSSAGEKDITDLHFMSGGTQENGQYITILTEKTDRMLYTPYYATAVSAPAVMHGDAYLINTEGVREYTVEYVSDVSETFVDPEYERFVQENCTYLEPSLAQALRELAEGWSINGQLPESAVLPDHIRWCISTSADYSLDTRYPPQGENPILWFLNSAKQGYCVHFASACAAMLRAHGIPARVVTGYCVATDGGWTSVSGRNAHAWTEYYQTGTGWIPLDATGATYSLMEMYSQQGNDPEVTLPAGATEGGNDMPEDTVSSSDSQTIPEPKDAETFTNANPNGVPRTGGSAAGLSRPQNSAVSGGQKNSGWEQVASVMLNIAGIAGLAAADVAVNRIVNSLRERKMTRGTACQRALACWEYANRLSRRLKEQPDETMRALVLKAQFARHPATEDEVRLLYEHACALREALRASGGPAAVLIDRYVRFLY